MLLQDEDYWVSHILDNLYMGGCFKGRFAPEHIEYMVSLDPYHLHEDFPRVKYSVYDLVDSEDYPLDLDSVSTALKTTLLFLEHGKTLVHCFAGVNRSGLICALALIELGHMPSDAINLLRAKRFPEVLSNKTFYNYVLNYTKGDLIQ